MIVSDDLKASALGCYGNEVCKTPNIDKLASRGMVFTRAYCQGTWCGPSRRSFMYSQYQGTDGKNLGEHFRASDYYSARVGKIYHMRVPGDIIDGTDGEDVASTWTEKFNSQGQEAHSEGLYACLNLNIFTRAPEDRQSTRMPHRMFVSVELDNDGAEQPDHKSATKAIELLEQHKQDSFFLAVGFVRPHYPMVAPAPLFEQYPWSQMQLPTTVENDLDDIPKLGKATTLSTKNPIGNYPDNQRRMWSAYYASVTFMDQQVGRLLDKLDALGLRDSTAVVFMSDHGYHLGEHHMWQKSNLHEEVTRVPLVVSAPGMKPGKSNSIVELVDVYPTLSDLCRLPSPDGIDGVSLVPILNDHEARVKPGALSFAKGTGFRTERWAYMKYTDGTQELYDMDADPLQFTNLALAPEMKPTLQMLDKQMRRQLGE
ncbi:MAG: sulfatase [Aureliella sp.]